MKSFVDVGWMLALIVLNFLLFSCGRHQQQEPSEVVEFRRPKNQEQKPQDPANPSNPGEPNRPQETVESQVRSAILAGDLVAIRRLIPAQHPIDGLVVDGKSALWLAVEDGLAGVVELLIELGAAPDQSISEGKQLSDLAREKGFRRIYWLLKPEETKKLTLELFQAITNSQLGPIRRVLDQQFEINFYFEDGDTPLTKTIQLQCLRCLQVVLNKKYLADPEFPDRQGRKPLELARASGVDKIIEFVEKAIEDVKARKTGEGI